MLQGSDWLLLGGKEFFLFIGVGGLSGVKSEVLPSIITTSVSVECSPCSVSSQLSGVVSGNSVSSEITVSFSGTRGWHDVMIDRYFDSGFVSEVAVLTTESKDLGKIILCVLSGFFLIYQYTNTRIAIRKSRTKGTIAGIQIESFMLSWKRVMQTSFDFSVLRSQ